MIYNSVTHHFTKHVRSFSSLYRAVRCAGKTSKTHNFVAETIWSRNYVRKSESDDVRIGAEASTTSNSGGKKVEELLQNSADFSEKNDADNIWSSSPYPKGAVPGQSQALKSFRPRIDPTQTSVILFPGQGSQFVGMGKHLLDYPNVNDMYEIASEILKYDLKKLCINGPKSELNKTEYCQAAILVTSLAAVEKLKDEDPEAVESCVATAGFSVGEFAALVFAGSITFEDVISVMKIRGEAMQAASELVPSGMMTVFFGADARLNYACVVAKEWCRKLGLDKPECRVANYLYPDCKVIAGNDEALQFIEMNAQDFGIRRLKRLPVSGAFHTDLMLPAEEPLREALKNIEISRPIISVHSNVDGKQYRNVEHIRRALVEQVSSPVKWEQILHILYEREESVGFPKTFECGPGKSLHAILKMVNAKAAANFTSIEV